MNVDREYAKDIIRGYQSETAAWHNLADDLARALEELHTVCLMFPAMVPDPPMEKAEAALAKWKAAHGQRG